MRIGGFDNVSSKLLYKRAFSTIPGVSAVRNGRRVQGSFNELAFRIHACARPLHPSIDNIQPARLKKEILLRFKEFIDLSNALDPREIYNMVSLFGGAVAIHDLQTERHQSRTTSLAIFLANGIMAASGKPIKIVELERACRLHDFGKIMISKELLRKKDPTATEMKIIRAHLEMSYFFTDAIRALKNAAAIIRYNHAYDGYPPECKVEDMPIESQILSLADCYDAITNLRHYRDGKQNPAEAISCLKKRKYSKVLLRAIDAYAAQFHVAP